MIKNQKNVNLTKIFSPKSMLDQKEGYPILVSFCVKTLK